MKLGNPRVWIAIVSALGVVAVAAVDMGRRAPGALTGVHQQVVGLSGSGSCDECHGGWRTSMTEACLECHESIGEQAEEGTGLHGSLGDDVLRVCAICHSEHHGADFEIVNLQSFFAAGVPNPAEFDHGIVGFPMGGKHLELGCTECHPNAQVALLPEGEMRYGGLDRDCSACHEDHHEGRYVLDCTKCHGQEAFDRHESVGHEDVLPSVAGHRETDCRACHAEDDSHSLERLGSREDRPPARACQDCHESPHAARFLEGVAALSSSSVGATCISCHEPEHASFREEGTSVSVEAHACSGFALEPPHDQAACDDCHPSAGDFAERHPGRGPAACASCHQDPHGGQFDHEPFAARGCVSCHARDHFEPHEFTVKKHDAEGLPLTGRHLEIDCEACHQAIDEETPRTFSGTPSRCEDCHEDAHAGFFDEATARLTPFEAGECGRCHLTTTFAEIPPGGFDHGEWTGFAVRGAHAESDCEACHAREAEAGVSGRTFGWVTEHFGPIEGCVTCHVDPHRGGFDDPAIARLDNRRGGCERCHVQSSFRAFPEGFSHGRWTGFPIDGVHGEIGCTPCHERLERADEYGRTWGRARGQRCSDCHANPHAGQFRIDGETDCRRCHRSAASFSELTFRHDRDSRFPLDEAHEALDCSACHHPWSLPDGGEVVRYRPLERECSDCHGGGAMKPSELRRGGGER